jgi:predicted enzyme related to lactoylglutathione lyase
MAGEINWYELAVEDTAKATAFFGSVFGWQTMPFEGQDYHLITAKIGELGGKPGEPSPIPGFGRIAHCEDDQGTTFSLFEQS